MPIYMDRHDVSAEVTAEIVAALHQADLKIQDKYDCRGITYWSDDIRKTAFCLIEAPNIRAIKRMHDKAHGEVPHHIIEVDTQIVESFLGRIEDPIKARNTKLNIINDPAFRTILYIELIPLTRIDQQADTLRNFILNGSNALNRYQGRLIKRTSRYLLASFKDVTHAVNCALYIQAEIKERLLTANKHEFHFNIGLHAGVPVTTSNGFFKETVKMAKRFASISTNNTIIVSSEVKDLYESEDIKNTIPLTNVRVIGPKQALFLFNFFDYLESQWENPQLKLSDFCINLGYSNSQFYRNIIAMSGKSPNLFLKEYRLHKALFLLEQQQLTIADIAYKTGFNSAAYFSKCFLNLFNVIPSVYLKQQNR